MDDNYDISALTKKSKKKINSKDKGNRFERKICKVLNEKFQTTEFARSPGSGAFATTHNLPEHLKVHGDILTPKNFRFVIECKSGYNKESLSSVFNEKSQLRKFIIQAKRDSEAEKKSFMLIVGQNNQKPIIITNTFVIVDIKPYLNIMIDSEVYKMMLLEDFLKVEDTYFWFC